MDKILFRWLSFIIGLLILSCSSQIDSKADSDISSYNLTVIDSTGRFHGRTLIMNISDSYESGTPKTISYIFGDTTLTMYLLESGFVKKKQTYIKKQLINETIINVEDWGESDIYQTKGVVTEYKSDTLVITVIDDSYIWFDEYVKWKSDYLIWLNYNKISEIKQIKTRFIQEGKPLKHEFLYSASEIHALDIKYSSNPDFVKISSIVLGFFTPTDVMNLRNAHNYINEVQDTYDKNLVELFYDFSLCESDCFAEDRLRFLGNMLIDVKLDDYWSDSKIEPNEFILRINKVFRIMDKEGFK